MGDDFTIRPNEQTVAASTSGALGPGLVLIYSAGRAMLECLPLGGKPLALGRDHSVFAGDQDEMKSAPHVSVAHHREGFEITDFGGRNGSAIDGTPLQGRVLSTGGRVLRVGHSLFLLCTDLSPYRSLGIKVHAGRAEGPALQLALRSVANLAEHSRTLFIIGESGSGKESLARSFHRAGPHQHGPFVAVNCATIPAGVAERLLFGAQKGAYSGAVSDSEGYVQAANGGTMFLDEVAELDASVQAKLLRVLESGEVTPLGATRPRTVDIRICSATHKDLRALVIAGKFRSDLYFRLGMPQVVVPPLRQRIEEIPWHVLRATAQVGPQLMVASQLIETCILRAWPGNVRELLAEINSAAVQALSDGSSTVSARHLRAEAGATLSIATLSQSASASQARSDSDKRASDERLDADKNAELRSPPTRTMLLVALVQALGNLSAAARALGLQRTQLRRYLEQHRIDLERVRKLTKG